VCFDIRFLKCFAFAGVWLLPSLAFLAVSGELKRDLGVGRSLVMVAYPADPPPSGYFGCGEGLCKSKAARALSTLTTEE
jgi:hypothetical protein